MPRNIRKIEPLAPKVPVKKRVATYARVSSGKDAMLHSLSAQISYMQTLVNIILNTREYKKNSNLSCTFS